MKLIDFMQAKGLSHREVADAIGIKGVNTIYRYNSGDRYPSPRVLRRIHEFTNGAVTANDFFHAPEPSQRSAS